MTGGVDMIWKRLAEQRVSGVQGQKTSKVVHTAQGVWLAMASASLVNITITGLGVEGCCTSVS